MKAKIAVSSALIMFLLVLGLGLGCQRTRSDAQIAGDVQNKINADPAVQSRQYTIAANKGVVTLAGYVSNDSERAAVANDAAQVPGVKTVVNDLQVTASAMAQQPEPPPAMAQQPESPQESALQEPAPVKRRERRRTPSGRTSAQSRSDQGYATQNDLSQPANVTTAYNTQPGQPAPPPKPAQVTIPEGTTFSIRLIDSIDSERNQTGDAFRATLNAPVRVGDTIAIPAGADIRGRVTDAKNAAHFSGRSELALELTGVSFNGKSYKLQTDQYARQGTARGKNTAEKVGGGAALGAILGGIFGGGKGAAIGATVGAGAGGTAQAVTRGEQVRLTSEQVLAFHLQSPLTVAPSSGNQQGRQRLDFEDNTAQ